jgi:S-(hydroxymethyl)mycothiol dehydrogenase
MPQTVRGVIARSKGAPVEIVDVVVPDPGPGEAVVAVQACGVCHTDLHYREGGINDEFPFLLGHEAAGVVESVGAGVTDVAPGDFVVLNWRAVCGSCRAGLRGKPWYCFNTHNAAQKMTLTDGTELSPRSASARSSTRRWCTRASAPRWTPRHRPRQAACSAAASWRASARRSTPAASGRGDSVAVIGCGGVARRHRRLGDRRRHHDRGRRHRPAKARVGQGLRRHPHGQQQEVDPG